MKEDQKLIQIQKQIQVHITKKYKYKKLRNEPTSMLVVAELEAICEMAEVMRQSRRRMREGGKAERLERTDPT